ncbi:MAG: dTDP-glucose 4,6-dehydratase [Ignavibacteria bacterium]|nr:dTDP-glucose 4,6-dehydratase [Ignavibacteria bacterium]
MNTILVTGGAGFIGSHFIDFLLKADSENYVINIDKLTYAGNLENLSFANSYKNYHFFKGDIVNRDLINYIFENYSPNIIINFAAESHVDRSINNPNDFIRTNVTGTANLLACAKDYWSKSNYDDKLFFQISTDEVYGSLPLDRPEQKFTEDSLIAPHNPYSASKAGADLLVQSYFNTYGLPTLISRCSNNFGTRQYPEKLVPLVITKAKQNMSVPVYGDGLNVRDWIYVEEHCRGVYKMMMSGKRGEVFNIGANNEISNIDLVKMILDIMGKPHSLINFVTDRLGHDRRYAIDASKAKAELGFVAENNFYRDLETTVKWYLE